MQALGRWLWYSPGLPARAARATLLAPSAAVAVAGRARAAAYAARVFGVRALPRPTVSVGNLAVGGTGKTPIASWIAAQIAARGLVPGILLRGGRWGDEALVHRRLVPPAVVIEHPDRHAGAALAVTRGADVLVLDDGYQRLDVGRDLNILLLSAEGASASQVLPAGPWREGWAALSRADLVGITHKRSSPERAQALQDRVARLAPSAATVTVHLDVVALDPLYGGAPLDMTWLRGRRVVAAAGIGDFAGFAGRLADGGARVRDLAWPDHHRYRSQDVRRMVAAARDVDAVIITEKDAVKLRHLWPAGGPQPLVARLDVIWSDGGRLLAAPLDRLAARAHLHTLN